VISNLDGEITEAAVSNIAFVAGGAVVTPPTGAGILEGVTRSILINSVARAAGVAVQERAIRPDELGAFEECFLLSTTKDIVPVRSIDSYAFRTGDNTITMTLKRAFAAYAADYSATHRSKLSVPGP
ncbi:MAG TPA: aminotransferase class IV, partial [Opitutaceae bacterium]|nr:aminotransferase class IV [Opitutaceae bacterium]